MSSRFPCPGVFSMVQRSSSKIVEAIRQHGFTQNQTAVSQKFPPHGWVQYNLLYGQLCLFPLCCHLFSNPFLNSSPEWTPMCWVTPNSHLLILYLVYLILLSLVQGVTGPHHISITSHPAWQELGQNCLYQLPSISRLCLSWMNFNHLTLLECSADKSWHSHPACSYQCLS